MDLSTRASLVSLAIICFATQIVPTISAETNTGQTTDGGELSVDEETQTPEGSAHVTNTIYNRIGDEFKSKKTTVPAALVDRIRKIVLDSEANSIPELKDYGITRESVEKNRDVMIRSAFSTPWKQDTKLPTFQSLPPDIQKLFEYETVAKNALSERTASKSTAYCCVVFSLPGKPQIMLLSRQRQAGMLPWFVRCEGRHWLCNDRTLPPLLAKLSTEKSKRALMDETTDFEMQDFNNRDAQKAKTWADAFFARYSKYSRDQAETYQDIESAKKIQGWPLVSNKFKFEDAKSYNDGSLDIQVDVIVPNAVVDKVRWRAEKSSKDNSYTPDWSSFWGWYQEMENTAKRTRWIDSWRKKESGRSVIAMQRDTIEQNLDESKMGWKERQRCKLWKSYGLEGRPKYYFRLLENGIHTRDVFVGNTSELSLVTNLGPGGGPTASLPKLMRSNTSSPLRMHEQGDERLTDRLIAVVNQDGKITKQNSNPSIYSLPADFPAPSAKEPEFDYSWPVDPAATEDLEYLNKRFEGEGEVLSVNFMHEPVLVGLVDKTGKVLVTPRWKWIGPFSCGLAHVVDQDKKNGFIADTGQVIIQPQYDSAETFYEGLAAVEKDNKYGFIDTKGTVVIPIEYDSVRRFAEGVAAVRKGTKFGFIDKTGKFVIAPQFGRARHFIKGLCYVLIDGKRAYIDHSGMPLGGKFREVLHRFSDDRALFYDDGKYGYIDRSGQEIIPTGITKAYDFRDGVAQVLVGDSQKAINKEGKFGPAPISHSDFWEGPIKEGLARLRKDAHHYGFSDRFGKIVIKPEFDNVGVFDGGVCPVETKEKWGVINRSGAFVVAPKYDGLDRNFSEGKIAFRTGSKWGVIDAKGQVVLEPTFTKIYPFKNGMAVVQQGLKFGYIDHKGKVVIAPLFDSAHQFSNEGIAHVEMRKDAIAVDRLP